MGLSLPWKMLICAGWKKRLRLRGETWRPWRLPAPSSDPCNGLGRAAQSRSSCPLLEGGRHWPTSHTQTLLTVLHQETCNVVLHQTFWLPSISFVGKRC